MNNNKKLDLTSVVRNINIHLDKNFYEEEFNTDVSKDTSMLVNKYYLLVVIMLLQIWLQFLRLILGEMQEVKKLGKLLMMHF